MDCADVKELFRGYLESRLTPFQSALLLQHCDVCSGCRRELIGLQARLSSPLASRRRFELHGIKAPLGVAGVLLVGLLGLYLFQREPAHIATAKPVATDSSPTELKPPPSLPREKAEPSASRSHASPQTPVKRSPDPMVAAKPRIAPPQNQAPAVKPGKPAEVEIAEANPSSKNDASLHSRESQEVPDTVQDAESTQDEKPADNGELRFYSETPPYFFLYKPSMKPL
ncbi:MAG TPA: hypothetical protein VKH64_00200 [Candidatus Binatia bacterium]|nr:hypothetical protein [Candidatus Binatia bacterium]